MVTSSTISLAQFKSPWRCLCRSLFQSREQWKAKARCGRSTIERLQQQLHIAQQQQRQLVAQLDEVKRHNEALQAGVDQKACSILSSQLAGHQFSSEMISLCCQLSHWVGFRAVPKVLQCISEAFGLPLKIPSRDAVRNWSCRNGVAILQQASGADDWVWMVDHSVQLGKMFVLVVLGIRQSQLPIDRPLTRDDMTPLAVMPTESRDKLEVRRQLMEVAKRLGTPLAILSDGARELHEGAESLKTIGFRGVHLDDIKHKVSNLLKKRLGQDERFREFLAQIGRTTASIQQTELDHLLPPRKKEKCRYMSLGQLIDWATMVECQLNLASTTKSNGSERLTEKLGWLKNHGDDLCCWRECRQLISQVLQYANGHGVFDGSTEALRSRLAECPTHSKLSQQLREEMLSFYESNERRLLALEPSQRRLPCSTEILESGFGSFKALQRHHARGTFTSLLAVFASLFDTCTATKIRDRFTRVSNQALKHWLHTSGLTNSTQSRRTQAYRGQLVIPPNT